MGADKEATDIWMFGRKRPDLSAEETFAEYQRRAKLMEEHAEARNDELLRRAPEMIDEIKRRAQAAGTIQ